MKQYKTLFKKLEDQEICDCGCENCKGHEKEEKVYQKQKLLYLKADENYINNLEVNKKSREFRGSEFIRKSKALWGEDFFDYSKVDYVNDSTKIILKCNKHDNWFHQSPVNNLLGYRGCQDCKKEAKTREDIVSSLTKETFEKIMIERNTWYSEGYEFIDKDTKIYLHCNIHNIDFKITPADFSKHLTSWCPKCRKEFNNTNYNPRNIDSGKQKFLEAAKKENIEMDPGEEYKGMNKKIKCHCTTHNEYFNITPNKVVYRHQTGCKECFSEKKRQKTIRDRYTLEEIKEFISVYWDNTIEYVSGYDQESTNNTTKLVFRCKEHNELYEQTLIGMLSMKRGCPKCQRLYEGENKLIKFLTDNLNTNIEVHARSNTMRKYNMDIIGNKELDIFMPEYNIAIEYQGEQHFRSKDHFGGEEEYGKLKKRDLEKYEECKNGGIKLYYFTYEKYHLPDNYIDKIYIDEDELLNDIKNYINMIEIEEKKQFKRLYRKLEDFNIDGECTCGKERKIKIDSEEEGSDG